MYFRIIINSRSSCGSKKQQAQKGSPKVKPSFKRNQLNINNNATQLMFQQVKEETCKNHKIYSINRSFYFYTVEKERYEC